MQQTKHTLQLNVNGTNIQREVEPRTHLADFLRESELLTGTNLGCEHGVCGACTIEMNTAPVRSCITYAITCQNAKIRTIEGFDSDHIMTQLKLAFTREHALQCGYCTSGMLVSAHDIVIRKPNASADEVREALAGNLCRCTGYAGIVRAIMSVLYAQANATSNG
jgi:carbon-monoxide dehydrogenase small subunit